MDYERIHKPQTQTGIISPSKLRMKLVEVHNQIKKKAASPRTSPPPHSRLHDSHLLDNCLLKDSDFVDDDDNQGSSLEDSLPNPSHEAERSNESLAAVKTHQIGRGETTRTVDDDNLDYDSNASSSSFEFHKAERASAASAAHRAFPRPVSSKWNDAEKWIMNRKTVQGSLAVKRGLAQQIQSSKLPGGNMGRVAPEGSSNDKLLFNNISSIKKLDFCSPELAKGLEKFTFVAHEEGSASVVDNPSAQSKNMIELNLNSAEEASGLAIRAVCMRDMGTEMTPIASQDPSTTSTPLMATTPFRSPTSSLPTTPRRGDLNSIPADNVPVGDDHIELSEEELKLKTRKEIMALGVQLGKVNIAAWASKEEKKLHNTPVRTAESKEIEKLEYDQRAAAWMEAENTKYSARFKRQEIQIQAWESQEKAKLEAEMRRIEAQIEQMRDQAQAKLVKKISMAKQKAEEQRIKAETRKNQFAEKTAAQAEYIRQTGRLPSSSSFRCCGF